MSKKEELRILNSNRALRNLLRQDKVDFEDTIEQLKYEKELVRLQAELIKVQNWIVENHIRLIVIVEGREFAGKGGTISKLTEHLNPRSVRVVALPKPSDREREQWYFQRYILQLPVGGEMVFFDRSWYNRAMVEPVNGFCTQEEYDRFMDEVIHFERMMVNDGIHLIKIFLTLSKKEQAKRIEAVRENPLRRWELTSVDENAQELWDEYTVFKEAMLTQTHTEKAPWSIIDASDKRKAHLAAIQHLIDTFPKA